MKTITNDVILDRIYDLADISGLRIDRFMERIEEEFGEQPIVTDGLPEEVVAELNYARDLKREQRNQARLKQAEEETRADIKRFREVFPDVDPDSIPDTVWEEVSGGCSLAHAFALFWAMQEGLKRHAEDVNTRNSERGAIATSDGSTEPSFTKEQVEKMNGKDIRNNYKGIIRAMKGWKF